MRAPAADGGGMMAFADMRSQLVSNPVVRRLASGTVANAVGKLWVLVIQLVSIPVLTHAWGIEAYGVWLMLITVPTYLSLSDFGLGAASTVEISRRAADGDTAGARRIFQSAWLFVTAISLVAGAIAYTVIIFVIEQPFSPSLNANVGTIGLNAVVLIGYSVLVVQSQQIVAVFRATNKYGRGTFLLDSLVFAESLIVLIPALAGAGILWSLMVLALSRGVIVAVLYFSIRQEEPWLSYGISKGWLKTIRGLAIPSLGAVALTISNSIAIQGVILVLGATAGPAATALFATARLISRVPLQFSVLVSRAAVPELTRAAHAGNGPVVRRLLLLSAGTALAAVVPFAAVLFLFGDRVGDLLTRGQLVPSRDLLTPLVVASVLAAVSGGLSTILVATNRHAAFSFAYLGTSILAVVIAATGSLTLTAWATVASEAAIFLLVAVQSGIIPRKAAAHG